MGVTEETVKEKQMNVSIYHSLFKPLEWEFLDERKEDYGYLKIICDKTQNERVVGLHYLGPNAGEVCMGFLTAVRMGATK